MAYYIIYSAVAAGKQQSKTEYRPIGILCCDQLAVQSNENKSPTSMSLAQRSVCIKKVTNKYSSETVRIFLNKNLAYLHSNNLAEGLNISLAGLMYQATGASCKLIVTAVLRTHRPCLEVYFAYNSVQLSNETTVYLNALNKEVLLDVYTSNLCLRSVFNSKEMVYDFYNLSVKSLAINPMPEPESDELQHLVYFAYEPVRRPVAVFQGNMNNKLVTVPFGLNKLDEYAKRFANQSASLEIVLPMTESEIKERNRVLENLNLIEISVKDKGQMFVCIGKSCYFSCQMSQISVGGYLAMNVKDALKVWTGHTEVNVTSGQVVIHLDDRFVIVIVSEQTEYTVHKIKDELKQVSNRPNNDPVPVLTASVDSFEEIKRGQVKNVPSATPPCKQPETNVQPATVKQHPPNPSPKRSPDVEKSGPVVGENVQNIVCYYTDDKCTPVRRGVFGYACGTQSMKVNKTNRSSSMIVSCHCIGCENLPQIEVNKLRSEHKSSIDKSEDQIIITLDSRRAFVAVNGNGGTGFKLNGLQTKLVLQGRIELFKYSMNFHIANLTSLKHDRLPPGRAEINITEGMLNIILLEPECFALMYDSQARMQYKLNGVIQKLSSQ